MAGRPIERSTKKKWSKPIARKLEGEEAERAFRQLMARGRLSELAIK